MPFLHFTANNFSEWPFNTLFIINFNVCDEFGGLCVTAAEDQIHDVCVFSLWNIIPEKNQENRKAKKKRK